MSGSSLTAYLGRVTWRGGYGVGITIYAFRNKATAEWH